jgi:hypothetical protein
MLDLDFGPGEARTLEVRSGDGEELGRRYSSARHERVISRADNVDAALIDVAGLDVPVRHECDGHVGIEIVHDERSTGPTPVRDPATVEAIAIVSLYRGAPH